MKRIDTASTEIPASPAVIYEAFLDPEQLMLWLPPEGMSGQIDVFEPFTGGAYQMTLTYEVSGHGKTSRHTDVSRGTFLELIPNEKIVMSVQFDSEDPSFAGEMIQTWRFDNVSHGTLVTIVCENVPDGIRKEDHDEGLNASLGQLRLFMAKQRD